MDILNPGDDEIRKEWYEWQRYLGYGYKTQCEEHRLMYLSLLERRDRAKDN